MGSLLDSEWRDRAGLNGCGPAEASYMKHRTEGHTETTISGDTRADWSDAFALAPSRQIAYVWPSIFTREVLNGLERIGRATCRRSLVRVSLVSPGWDDDLARPKSSTFTPSLISMTGPKSWSVQIFGWFSEATGIAFPFETGAQIVALGDMFRQDLEGDRTVKPSFRGPYRPRPCQRLQSWRGSRKSRVYRLLIGAFA